MTQVIETPQLKRLTPEQAERIRARATELFAGRNPIGDAKTLQYARRCADLSQSQLAEAAGCSVMVIANIENGRTKFRGARREALWTAILHALEAKYQREDAAIPRLEAVIRLNRTKELADELATDKEILLQRVGELEARVARLTEQLARHIDAMRPALESLEREASREGGDILRGSNGE